MCVELRIASHLREVIDDSALALIYVNLRVVRGMHDFQPEFLYFLALCYEK